MSQLFWVELQKQKKSWTPLLDVTSEEQRLANYQKISGRRSTTQTWRYDMYFLAILFWLVSYVEKSVILILSGYGRLNGNGEIKRFVEKNVSRKNSMNCNKVKEILDLFNTGWDQLKQSTSNEVRDSVDSLKAFRDRIAHGYPNGTGFTMVNSYFLDSQYFVKSFSLTVLGH